MLGGLLGDLCQARRGVLELQVGIGFPDPVAGILFEIIEKQADNLLLLLDLDLVERAHDDQVAHVHDGEQDEQCIDGQQDRNEKKEILAGRGEGKERAGDDRA